MNLIFNKSYALFLHLPLVEKLYFSVENFVLSYGILSFFSMFASWLFINSANIFAYRILVSMFQRY